MSDSNRIRVSFVEEDGSFGVTPSSPVMLILPTSGQSMRDRIGYQQSQIIRDDANVQDLVRLSKSAGGGLPSEWMWAASGSPNEALYEAMRAVMRSTPTAAATQVTGVAASSNVLSASGVGTGVEVGDIVRIRTSGDVLVGYRRVTVRNADDITVAPSIGDATGLKVLRGERFKNGATDRSFSVEIARLDITKFQVFTGQVFNTFDLTIADEAITTCAFGLEGSSSTRGNSGPASASYSSPAARAVMDSVGNLPTFYVGGAAFAAKSIGVGINNGAAGRTQIGALGPQSMRRGQFIVTGRIQAYMDGFAEFDNYANNVATDLFFVTEDVTGAAWSFSLPQVKWSDASADTSGPNQDDYKDLAFQSILDPVELCTLRLQRFVA